MDDSSIDLIVTDPPYFKVKADWWDRQWEKPEAFLSWMGGLCDEWQRVLKPNGSLYVFASPQMSHGVETEVRKRFNVLTNIRWRKPPFSTKAEMFAKEDLRAPFPASETIIFAEQFGSDASARGESTYAAKCEELRGFVFEPLRAYLESECVAAGYTVSRVQDEWRAHAGTNGVFKCLNSSEWRMVTVRTYAFLAGLCGGLSRDYEDLRREYDDLRREYEDLRRPFYASDKRPYTDVWDYATVSDYPGKHPCEKPLAMMEHIVETSSTPGALVLDCFAGSGVVGEACRNFGRRAILCEVDQRWYRKITARIGQRTLFAG